MEIKQSLDRLIYFRGPFDYGQKLKRKKHVTLCSVSENRYELRTKQERQFIRLFKRHMCMSGMKAGVGVCCNAIKWIDI
jgi:hypothetical protein